MNAVTSTSTDAAPMAHTASEEAVLRQARLTAIVVAGAMFMMGLDSTVLMTALPRMASDYGVSATALSSTITVYVLVSSALMPASSWVGQQFGPRRIFTMAIIGFTLSSVACGMAPSLPLFLLARVVQAAFGSLMVPVGSLALLRITPKHYMVAAMAISSTPALIAPVVGPPIGGFITTVLEWPWVFYINLPLGLIGVFMARRFIPPLKADERVPFDFSGYWMAAGTICLLISGLDRLSHDMHRLGGGLIAGGFVLGLFAWRHSRTAAHPIVPMAPLRHPCFHAATLGAGTPARLAFSAQGFVLPLMLQLGLGLSPFQAGILLLAQNAGDLVLKPVAGKALRLLGFRNALVSGSLIMGASLAAVSFLTPSMSFELLFVILFAVGMCRSIFFTALMALRFADVPQEELGGAQVLGNLSNALSQAGAISASALLINLLSGAARTPTLGAFHGAMLVLAAAAAASGPLFLRLAKDAGDEVSGRTMRNARREAEAEAAIAPVETDATGQAE